MMPTEPPCNIIRHCNWHSHGSGAAGSSARWAKQGQRVSLVHLSGFWFGVCVELECECWWFLSPVEQFYYIIAFTVHRFTQSSCFIKGIQTLIATAYLVSSRSCPCYVHYLDVPIIALQINCFYHEVYPTFGLSNFQYGTQVMEMRLLHCCTQVRKDKPFRLALCSFREEASNYVQLLNRELS